MITIGALVDQFPIDLFEPGVGRNLLEVVVNHCVVYHNTLILSRLGVQDSFHDIGVEIIRGNILWYGLDP